MKNTNFSIEYLKTLDIYINSGSDFKIEITKTDFLSFIKTFLNPFKSKVPWRNILLDSYTYFSKNNYQKDARRNIDLFINLVINGAFSHSFIPKQEEFKRLHKVIIAYYDLNHKGFYQIEFFVVKNV